MKSSFRPNVSHKRYPKLMIRKHPKDDLIVLFTARKTGFVVKSNVLPIGSESREWGMENFADFTGKVIIEQ